MQRPSRRAVIQVVWVGAMTAFPGCGTPEDGDRSATLRIFPEVERSESGWQMTVKVENDTNHVASIHDVTMVAFDDQGNEVCRRSMGDFPRGAPYERTETVSCERFPAIVTATAEETPCDGANIEIVYWTGSPDQRGEDIPRGEFVWDYTFRKCDEPLPPQRVLDKVNQTEPTESDQ